MMKTNTERIFSQFRNYKATGVSKSRNPQYVRPLHYQAYVLRFWQEPNADNETAVWRFTLINTTTNSEYGFANFQELVAFLENGLRDPNLNRYQPEEVLSGNCFPNNDQQSKAELGCN